MSNDKKMKDETSFINNSEGKQAGLISELVGYLKNNKKYWMVPILLALLFLGLIILLGGTNAAPFIYTLF